MTQTLTRPQFLCMLRGVDGQAICGVADDPDTAARAAEEALGGPAVAASCLVVDVPLGHKLIVEADDFEGVRWFTEPMGEDS